VLRLLTFENVERPKMAQWTLVGLVVTPCQDRILDTHVAEWIAIPGIGRTKAGVGPGSQLSALVSKTAKTWSPGALSQISLRTSRGYAHEESREVAWGMGSSEAVRIQTAHFPRNAFQVSVVFKV
jgi:hypothetical protein